MSQAYHFRLVTLVTALVATAALLLGVVHQSWRRFDSLERQLTSGLLESFRLAADFQGRLHQLDNIMLRYSARHEPAIRAEFQQASAALNQWIDQRDPQLNRTSDLTTENERQLFRQINNAFDDYLQAADEVLSNPDRATSSAEARAPLDRFERETQRLLVFGGDLAEAHRRAQAAFLGDANRSLDILRRVTIMVIVLMLLLVGGAGLVIYRDLIAPLRIRLGQSEGLLEKQEKLATLGTLAAGIAHEIRNPLTSIKARLYTLAKHIQGNQAGIGDAEMINAEIARLERIVQDVLSFARPSEPNTVVVPALAPLTEVHSLMAGTLERDGVRLLLETGVNAPVSMDPALIKQVLINLIRNAAEAIDGEGTITLRVRRDHHPIHGTDRAVVILEVADTGRGIPPEVEKRLFDPFFTTKDAGTGLGLAIAMRIVEKSGGILQYRTQVDHGTTFGIILPAAPESGETTPARNEH